MSTMQPLTLEKLLAPDEVRSFAGYYWVFVNGTNAYRAGQVSLASVTDEQAEAEVGDGRLNYRVEFQVSNNRLISSCTCSRGKKEQWCTHKVAAGMAVFEYLENQRRKKWQYRLENLAKINTRHRTKQRVPYWLFVGLVHTYDKIYLQPYRLWFTKMPADIWPSDASLTPDLLTQLVSHNPWMTDYIKPFQKGSDLENCVNLPPTAYSAINVLQQSLSVWNTAQRYYYSPNSVYDLGMLIDLVLRENIPLFYIPNEKFEQMESVSVFVDVHPVLKIGRAKQGLDGKIVWQGTDLTGVVQALETQLTDVTLLTSSSPIWGVKQNVLVRFREELSESALRDSVEIEGHFQIPPEELSEFSAATSALSNSNIDFLAEGATETQVQGDFVPRLYLAEENGEFQAQLHFAYGEHALPYAKDAPEHVRLFEPETWEVVSIDRQIEKEQELYDNLRSARYGLKRSPNNYADNVFLLRAKVDVVDFLLKKVPRLLEEGFEIYGEENLKSVRVNRHPPSISMNITSGIDWFDLQAAVKFGDTEANWKDVRWAIRKQERFIKLTDGSIGEIPEEWIKRYRRLFGVAEETEDGLRVDDQQILLLDQLLEDLDEFHVDEEFQRRRERLRNFGGIQKVPLPEGFVGELRPYQVAGYHWLHFLHEYELGGCLADDMGLGKTVQVLAFLLSLRESGHAQAPDLIVVPRSLLVNWQREAARFTPTLKTMLHFGQTRTKENPSFGAYDLVVTTYGTLLRDVRLLREYRFHYVVLDESQNVKNPLAKTSRAARRLNCDHRLVMTGTPVENTTFELWSQFAFLNPGLLGSLEYFKEEYGMPIEKKQDESVATSLRRMVYPFILRRTKDQVTPELPPRTERIIYCDMESAQKKFYLHTRDYYRAQLLGILDEKGMDNARMKILEGLLRLRQICNHPKLVKSNFRGDSAKMEAVVEILETLHGEGHKALVFSQFVQMLTLLRQELDARHIPYEYLDGSTTNRQTRIDHFQSDESIPFFLISLKAGGVGLNLTAADYVLHVDPWWNPAVEMQATDRTHRIGQEKPVFVYKFITRDSVEEKVLQLQERKKALVSQLISTEGAFFKNLTADDVSVLFGE